MSARGSTGGTAFDATACLSAASCGFKTCCCEGGGGYDDPCCNQNSPTNCSVECTYSNLTGYQTALFDASERTITINEFQLVSMAADGTYSYVRADYLNPFVVDYVANADFSARPRKLWDPNTMDFCCFDEMSRYSRNTYQIPFGPGSGPGVLTINGGTPSALISFINTQKYIPYNYSGIYVSPYGNNSLWTNFQGTRRDVLWINANLYAESQGAVPGSFRFQASFGIDGSLSPGFNGLYSYNFIHSIPDDIVIRRNESLNISSILTNEECVSGFLAEYDLDYVVQSVDGRELRVLLNLHDYVLMQMYDCI